MTAILAAYPDARGLLYERPHASEGARAYLTKANAATRCELVTGSFLESVPAGADVYLLKSILHDWDDARCATVLRNCRRAMAATGRLLLIERIVPARFEACAHHRNIARSDLTMLIGHEGRERSEAELNILLDSCGFALTRVIPTALGFSIVEAVPHTSHSG